MNESDESEEETIQEVDGYYCTFCREFHIIRYCHDCGTDEHGDDNCDQNYYSSGGMGC